MEVDVKYVIQEQQKFVYSNLRIPCKEKSEFPASSSCSDDWWKKINYAHGTDK